MFDRLSGGATPIIGCFSICKYADAKFLKHLLFGILGDIIDQNTIFDKVCYRLKQKNPQFSQFSFYRSLFCLLHGWNRKIIYSGQTLTGSFSLKLTASQFICSMRALRPHRPLEVKKLRRLCRGQLHQDCEWGGPRAWRSSLASRTHPISGTQFNILALSLA